MFSLGLGVAGASFAVALPIASRAYPPSAQGLILGIAASGNVGTVLILFLAPRWAAVMDWHQICGIMAAVVAVTLVAFELLVPRMSPTPEGGVGAWWYHVAELIRQRSAYWLCFLYAITFGGFVGLCSVIPLLLHDVYRIEAIEAGIIAALCGLIVQSAGMLPIAKGDCGRSIMCCRLLRGRWLQSLARRTLWAWRCWWSRRRQWDSATAWSFSSLPNGFLETSDWRRVWSVRQAPLVVLSCRF